MPSKVPNLQEKEFRRTLGGGFNRDDVLSYVNALANEAQQCELEYEEKTRQLQAQIEKLKKEQSNARACVEKLQEALAQAEARATQAEEQCKTLKSDLQVAESRAEDYQNRYSNSQQAMVEWRFKCHDLERQLAERAAEPVKAEASVVEESAGETKPATEPVAPQPVAEPQTAVVPEANTENALLSAKETARIEARKILADARLTVENAEARLRQQEAAQRSRMQENAEALAAGVLVLKQRLARVDDRLNSASMDLERATAAIYQALDQTSADLEGLGANLRKFGDPETAEAPKEPELPLAVVVRPMAGPAQGSAKPEAVAPKVVKSVKAPKATLRPKLAPQPVPGVCGTAMPQEPELPQRRLRRASNRPVSQELLDAIDRMEGEN